MARVRNRVTIPVGKNQSYAAEFVSFHDLSDGEEHIALVFGGAETAATTPLVRLHSQCLTGDIFNSARCDCGSQLDEAIETMAANGGIILYLRQEGRGIGLYNKLDAYSLQDDGLDTYAANQALGFDDDLRDFGIAAEMLHALGIPRIDLLTNNPQKVETIKAHGIEVRRQQHTGVYYTRHNGHYLRAKADKAKHVIDLGRKQKLAS